MLFEVKPARFRPPTKPTNQVYLITDHWDDWYTFTTMYSLSYVDADGEIHYIGSVKIGEVGMTEGRPNIPASFKRLDKTFFSLGQDVTYYEKLNQLGDDIRHEILSGLNDVALLPNIYEKVQNENVMCRSLVLLYSLHLSYLGTYFTRPIEQPKASTFLLSNLFILLTPTQKGNKAFQKHFHLTDGTTIRAIGSTFRVQMEYSPLGHPDRPMRFALVWNRGVNPQHGKGKTRAQPTNYTVSRPESRRNVQKARAGKPPSRI